MMGVDPDSGRVIDTHHPLQGRCVKDRILAIPCGRGSCAASGIILETLVNDCGPAALIFQKQEPILTLGVLVAKAMFGRSIPILVVPNENDFLSLRKMDEIRISRDSLRIYPGNASWPISQQSSELSLSKEDREILNGARGEASRMAMEVLVSFAEAQGAPHLISVSQVHIDACVYMGKSSHLFAKKLHAAGGRFVVPSTMNSISVDQRRWKELGVDPVFSENATNLADTYAAMGGKQSYTCAPYLLETAPSNGDQIGWGESNAVVFANSVLGARTQKYPDFLDVFIALTGRAPFSGCHMAEGRLPKIHIQVPPMHGADESIFPLLGYHIGFLAGSDIPWIEGMEYLRPTISDMKAFGAGFATTSSASMFHIAGVTPEAKASGISHDALPKVVITTDELAMSHEKLNSATDSSVQLVSLGNPHFSLEEFERLVGLIKKRQKNPKTDLIITTGRAVYADACKVGYTDEVERFGGRLISDTCWCLLQEPVISPDARNLMTNSSKYAHYGPGMLKRGYHFVSLQDCVDAAFSGEHVYKRPSWLS